MFYSRESFVNLRHAKITDILTPDNEKMNYIEITKRNLCQDEGDGQVLTSLICLV